MKIRTAKEELELLHRIIHIISSTIDLSELLKAISKMMVEVLKSDSCLIYLYDEHEHSLVLSGAHNPHPAALGKVKMRLGEGLTGWTATHRKPIAISKKAYEDPRFKFFSTLPEDKYESFLSVPILCNGLLTGVINLHRKKAQEHPSSEIELLSTISKLVAGSIENARLYSEANRRARQIETLAQVSRLVAGESYLEELLRLIVSITAESLGFKICSLMLLDESEKELSIVATQSLSEEYRKKPPVKVEKSLSGKAIRGGKPFAILDVREESEYHYPEIARREGLVSLLTVPMMVKDKCIGVLNCYTHKIHQFKETEIKILASVANQSAIAIENTRLMEKALESQEELAARKFIERAKGILMKEKNLTEDEAFREMRKTAMDKRKSMKEISEALILSREIEFGKTVVKG